jgi:hypothetical protein
MMDTVVLLAAAVVAVQAPAGGYPTDTTLAVERGSRLRVNSMGGDIVVRAWDRGQVRIQADHSRNAGISIERRGSVVDVGSRGRWGAPGLVDYQITVPAWMALELGGLNAEVDVDGVRAAVRVETIQGSIRLRGGADQVTLSTANGGIDVAGVRGRLDLRALSGDIVARDIEGDVMAESVSGDVDLRGVTARSVEARAVSGDVLFAGTVADGGTYSLFTHSGDITLAVDDRANALLTVASANGDIRFGFDVRAERTTRRRQTYRLGSGSASVELETFSGDIRVVRPGEVRDAGRDDRRSRASRPPRPPRPGPDHDSMEDQ